MKRVIAVVLGMAVAGALAGAVWVVLAPPVHGVVALTKAGERVHVYLGNEADHFFVSAVIMVGLLILVAIVAAVLVWQWRRHRGPWMVVALTLGGLVAAGVATAVGAVLGRVRYGVLDIAGAPVSPQHRVHYVVEASTVFFGHSPLQALATLLVPAVAAAMTYAALAAGSAQDDLGATASSSVPEAAR
jgi:cytochrome bd-type quinol oxidase subunit 1